MTGARKCAVVSTCAYLLMAFVLTTFVDGFVAPSEKCRRLLSSPIILEDNMERIICLRRSLNYNPSPDATGRLYYWPVFVETVVVIHKKRPNRTQLSLDNNELKHLFSLDGWNHTLETKLTDYFGMCTQRLMWMSQENPTFTEEFAKMLGMKGRGSALADFQTATDDQALTSVRLTDALMTYIPYETIDNEAIQKEISLIAYQKNSNSTFVTLEDYKRSAVAHLKEEIARNPSWDFRSPLEMSLAGDDAHYPLNIIGYLVTSLSDPADCQQLSLIHPTLVWALINANTSSHLIKLPAEFGANMLNAIDSICHFTVPPVAAPTSSDLAITIVMVCIIALFALFVGGYILRYLITLRAEQMTIQKWIIPADTVSIGSRLSLASSSLSMGSEAATSQMSMVVTSVDDQKKASSTTETDFYEDEPALDMDDDNSPKSSRMIMVSKGTLVQDLYDNEMRRYETKSAWIPAEKKDIIIFRAAVLNTPSSFSKFSINKVTHLLKSIKHENVLAMRGMLNPHSQNDKDIPLIYHVYESPGKGSLHHLLTKSPYAFNTDMKYMLAADVSRGMLYLQKQGIVHGLLDTFNCLVDNNWTVKLDELKKVNKSFGNSGCETKRATDCTIDCHIFTLYTFWIANWCQSCIAEYEDDLRTIYTSRIHYEAIKHHLTENQIRRLIFRHPALAKNNGQFPGIQLKHDLYSFGMVLVEIFTRETPHAEGSLIIGWLDVLDEVVSGKKKAIFSPEIPLSVRDLIMKMTKEDSLMTFEGVNMTLELNRPNAKSMVDILMVAMEEYMLRLEDKVKERTGELEKITDRMGQLLESMLPKEVAYKLQNGQAVTPQYYNQCTVYFSDIVSFTKLSSESSALQVVHLLNNLYTLFDNVIESHDVYKVETIGDAYMCVSGVPNVNGHEHVSHICKAACDVVRAMATFKVPHKKDVTLNIRIGINSGPVMAGVVGLKMPRYCLFGDCVNTASRMESTSLPNMIQASHDTVLLLNKHYSNQFNIQLRGETHIKGKGSMQTFWISNDVHECRVRIVK